MDILEKIKRKKKENLIFIWFLYGITIIFTLQFYRAYLTIKDISKLEDILNLMSININSKFLFLPNKEYMQLALFITMGFIIWSLIIITDDKKFMKGIEHGSSRWASKKEKRKFEDKDLQKNIILTEEIKMSLNLKKTKRNANILVIGGSGTGKTRFFVKPNLMQLNTSYIVTDPKGDLFKETGKVMKKNGYKVKVFNTKNMEKTMHYNPFSYVKKDEDVFKLIKVLIKNTNEGKSGGNDPFWEKAETALLCAIMFYLYHEAPRYEQNLPMVIEMLRAAQVKEDDEDYISDLDILFAELEKENKNHIALKQYKVFKAASGKTAKSILISTMSRLSFLDIPAVEEMLSYDELQIDKLADERSILYIIIPDTDSSFNFLVAMLYTQLFDTLCYVADTYTLKNHVRVILDEFANIGQIPDFEKVLATIRSRGISANIILQSLSQIKNLYKTSWESIIDNCDTTLFLGGQQTAEWISKKLGKMTIDSKVTNFSKGKNSSTSINYSIIGRDLMTSSEIEQMKYDECICFIKGCRPMYSKKFKIENHKNYNLLGDSENQSNKNNFSFNDLELKENIYKKVIEENEKKIEEQRKVKEKEEKLKNENYLQEVLQHVDDLEVEFFDEDE